MLTLEEGLNLVAGEVGKAPIPQLPIEDRFSYNCWGFVSHTLKWTDSLYWLHREEMEVLLSSNTFMVDPNKINAGDIVGYYQEGLLLHTALYIQDGNIIHKPGTYELEINSIDETIANEDYYPDTDEVIFFRSISQEK